MACSKLQALKSALKKSLEANLSCHDAFECKYTCEIAGLKSNWIWKFPWFIAFLRFWTNLLLELTSYQLYFMTIPHKFNELYMTSWSNCVDRYYMHGITLTRKVAWEKFPRWIIFETFKEILPMYLNDRTLNAKLRNFSILYNHKKCM